MDGQLQIYEQEVGTLFHKVFIKNKLTNESISILPNLGARLNSANLRFGEELIAVLSELKDQKLTSSDEIFNNAKLFPFAGRIKKGIYSFKNKTYNLPINYVEEENATHGFLYDRKFKVINMKNAGDYAEIELEYVPANNLIGYPFDFRMTVVYKFSAEGEVTVTTKVFNQDKSEILFSDGWHPYYKLCQSIDDLKIEFNVEEKVELNQDKIPNGIKFPLNGSSVQQIDLKNKSLDDVFRYSSNNEINFVNIFSKDSSRKLNIWHEAGLNKYNYLVLYTPPDRKSIAVEPMTSNINAFNNKEGLIITEPGEAWSASYGFSLKG
jgi:aldose 1-epimerase